MVFKAFHLEIFYHQRNIEEVQGDVERKTEGIIQNMMHWIMCFSPQTVGNDQFHHGELRKTLSLYYTRICRGVTPKQQITLHNPPPCETQTPFIAPQLTTDTMADLWNSAPAGRVQMPLLRGAEQCREYKNLLHNRNCECFVM